MVAVGVAALVSSYSVTVTVETKKVHKHATKGPTLLKHPTVQQGTQLLAREPLQFLAGRVRVVPNPPHLTGQDQKLDEFMGGGKAMKINK